jgi:hypothetical protein
LPARQPFRGGVRNEGKGEGDDSEVSMWRLIPWKFVLSWLAKNAKFDLVPSEVKPDKATRLLGHDIPNVPDAFLILYVKVGSANFTGYWQKS